MARFKELHLGDTFDFIGPDRDRNSFFDRCIKIGARTYRSVENRHDVMHHVGSINCEVFHIENRAFSQDVSTEDQDHTFNAIRAALS